jgi:hypothetical protein
LKITFLDSGGELTWKLLSMKQFGDENYLIPVFWWREEAPVCEELNFFLDWHEVHTDFPVDLQNLWEYE